MNDRLAQPVRALIHDHIGSVGALELLLTLRSAPEQTWSVDDMCAAIECPASWAQIQLDSMTAAGFAEALGAGWRYAPIDTQRREAVDALDEAYRLQTRDVLRFVFAGAGDELRAFSDAFRVRRDEGR